MPGSRYKYNQVVRFITEELLPSLRAGDLLPPPHELCSMTGVSPITVTRALKILGDAGRIRRIKNKGAVVLPPPEAAGPPPPSPPDEKVLRVIGLHPFTWNLMKIMEDVFESYRRYHPEIKFQIEYPPLPQWFECLRKNDYDLIFVNTFFLREIVTTPSLVARVLPVSDLKGLHFELDDFHPALARACRSRDLWHTVPLAAGPSLQIINPRYPGLEASTPGLPRKWRDYWQYLRSVRQPGRPIFYLNMSLSYLEPMLRMHKLSLFSEDGRRCELDRPETVELLAELYSMCGNEKLILPSTSGLDDDVPTSRESIFRALGLKWASTVDFSAANRDIWRIAPLPEARQKAAHLFIEGVMAGAGASPRAVAEFLNFLQGAGVQTRLTGCSGMVCRKDLLALQLAQLEPYYQGITSTFDEALDYAAPCLPYARQEACQTVTKYLVAICNGLISPEEGCKAAAAEANAVLKEMTFTDK